MSSVIEFFKASAWGLPRWGWALLAIAMVVNEIFSWTKKTKAQSTLQAIVRLVLRLPVVSAVIVRVPLVGAALSYLAGPDPEGATGTRAAKPADPPSSAAAVVLVLAGLLGLGVAMAGCSLTPRARAHVALATAADIGSAADKAITAYDIAIDAAAVDEATAAKSTAAARAKLAEWRPKLAKARAAESAYYAGLLGWQVSLQVAENAIDKNFDFAGLIAGLAKLGKELIGVLSAFGVPGLPKIGGL